MAAHYKSGNDKSNNNENKVYLLLKRWDLIGHVLNHMLDHVLDHILDQMLDQIIIGLVTTTLQLPSFFVLAPTNK